MKKYKVLMPNSKCSYLSEIGKEFELFDGIISINDFHENELNIETLIHLGIIEKVESSNEGAKCEPKFRIGEKVIFTGGYRGKITYFGIIDGIQIEENKITYHTSFSGSFLEGREWIDGNNLVAVTDNEKLFFIN